MAKCAGSATKQIIPYFIFIHSSSHIRTDLDLSMGIIYRLTKSVFWYIVPNFVIFDILLNLVFLVHCEYN